MSKAKHWCFTLNNYNEDDLVQLRTYSHEERRKSVGVRYVVFQQEVGQEGTPHLQGYVIFDSRKRISSVKKVVGDRAHLIVAKGNPDQNRTYCTKGDTRIEGTNAESYGDIPESKQGQRSDIREFMSSVEEGETNVQVLRKKHPEVWARYPRFCIDYIRDNLKKFDVPDHELYPWQERLRMMLSEPPNDREIIFVVDENGNAGKTYFAKWFCKRNENAQFMEPGKKADMAYSLDVETDVLFVNVTRQQVDHLQYSFLEACKDGLVFSPKYESGMKYLKPMHLVVLMNQPPDMNMLSLDRYVILKDLN